jgi:hypothetical protein
MARPPGHVDIRALSCRLTSLTVTPADASFAGSSATRISRSTPPTRSTLATPRSPRSARLTVSSTNQEISSGVLLGARRP